MRLLERFSPYRFAGPKVKPLCIRLFCKGVKLTQSTLRLLSCSSSGCEQVSFRKILNNYSLIIYRNLDATELYIKKKRKSQHSIQCTLYRLSPSLSLFPRLYNSTLHLDSTSSLYTSLYTTG